MSSLARRLFSRSVTAARLATGSHLHRIDGYSLLEQATKTGSAVSSKTFRVGGRKWQLHLYPNGISADHRGFVSADLRLAHGYGDDDDDEKEEATATYRVSILDQAGNPAHSATVGPCRFGGSSRYAAGLISRLSEDELRMRRTSVVGELVAAEELRRAAPFVLGRNDRLDVRCDVSVVDTRRRFLGLALTRTSTEKLQFLALFAVIVSANPLVFPLLFH